MTIQRLLTVSLLATAFAAAATPALANQDAVQFGSNIHVAPDASVHDAVCFFCNVDVEGTVTGDIVVFFGSVHVSGAAQHDVVNFFGEIRVDDNVSIGHDMVSMFGAVRLGENVSVGKDLVAMFGVARTPASVTVGGDHVTMPGWILFGPLILVGFVVFLIVHEIRAYHRRQLLRGYPFPPNQ
jgi:hypothetical protein